MQSTVLTERVCSLEANERPEKAVVTKRENLIMKLSIIIPIYNEKNTLPELLERVEKAEVEGVLEKEVILVDDFSMDGTRDFLKNLNKGNYKVILHDKNYGKGAAVRGGFKEAGGDIFLIQDADLEYDPEDYQLLLKPILDGRADVVYGSRFTGHQPHRVLYNSHYVANRFLTFFSNLFTGLNLSDMETGYKVFTAEAARKILPRLTSDRFGIEPELTAQVAKHNFRIYEVGISYHGRTYAEGKKINWKDGLAAIWHIIKFNLF